MTMSASKMKTQLLIAGAVVLVCTSAPAQASGDTASVRDRFVGAWRLASLEEADGKAHKADCTGLLVFTRDGHMSVQVMYRDAQPAGQDGTVQYVQGGYEASFGTYEIGDAHTFTFHVDGAIVRSLIGKDPSLRSG
jgi:hypothetical protein